METLFFIKSIKFEAFLPSMMKILEVGSEDEKLKIIEVFRNVLGQLKKSKASSIAVALVGKILPLFDSVRLLWEPEPCRKQHSEQAQPSRNGFWALLVPALECALGAWPSPQARAGSCCFRAGLSPLLAGARPAARALPLAPQGPAEVRGEEG